MGHSTTSRTSEEVAAKIAELDRRRPVIGQMIRLLIDRVLDLVREHGEHGADALLSEYIDRFGDRNLTDDEAIEAIDWLAAA